MQRISNIKPNGSPVTLLASPTFHDQAAACIQKITHDTTELEEAQGKRPNDSQCSKCGSRGVVVRCVKPQLANVKWTTFPDGTPSTRIDLEDVQGRHVIFWSDLSAVQNLFEVLGVLYALPRYQASSVTLLLPYFATGTMERVDVEGEIATAKTLARVISATPPPAITSTNLVIIDIHSLPTRFYFSDSIHVTLISAIPLLKRRLKQLLNDSGSQADDVTIAFPDEGARKRFGRMFPEYPLVICNKVREGDKRIVRIAEGSAKGRHCVIVDDLVQSGGTLISCREALYKAGAAEVSCYVTHGVFPGGGWGKMLVSNTPKGQRPFKHFWMTDTVPRVAKEVEGKAPFEILSIAPLIGQLVERSMVESGHPLSLFDAPWSKL